MPKLTSDEVNFLVWQYLQEEGLTRTAFMLKTEAPQFYTEASHNTASGELIRLLLRGFEYDEIESQTVAGNRLLDPQESSNAVKIESGTNEPTSEQDGTLEDDTMDVASTEPIAAGLSLADSPIPGGISAVYTLEWVVIAGLHEVVVYNASNPSKHDHKILECNEMPTYIAPESSGVLVGYLTGSVRRWQLDTTPFVLQSVLTPETDAPLSPVAKVCRSPYGNKIAVLHLDGQIRVWNLIERQLTHTFNSFDEEQTQSLQSVTDVVWMGSDLAFAVAHSKGVAIYHLDETAPSALNNLATSSGAGAVALLVYNDILHLVAGASDEGHVWVWSSSTVSPVREMKIGSLPAPVSSIHWVGAFVLAGTTDGSLQLFDTRLEAEEKTVRPTAETVLKSPIFDIEVGPASSSSQPSWFAVITGDGVECYKIRNNKFVVAGSLTLPGIECVVSSEHRLAVVTRDHTYIVGR